MDKEYELYDVSIKLDTANTLISMLSDYINDSSIETSGDAILFASNQKRMSALVYALSDYVYDSSEIVNRLDEQAEEARA
ncbi:MAG: hypothetical protein ACLR3S_04290 [Clostridium fessum]